MNRYSPQSSPKQARPYRFLVNMSLMALFLSQTASAESYFGADIGLGSASGTAASEDSGLVLGATAGYQLTPEFGLGLTYQHSSLGLSGSNLGVGVTQYLVEANIFSLLLLHGGLHVGDVHTSISNSSSNDLGFGAHLGFDIRITDYFSAGLGLYWTYVTQANDKHSLFNIVIPLKVWF